MKDDQDDVEVQLLILMMVVVMVVVVVTLMMVVMMVTLVMMMETHFCDLQPSLHESVKTIAASPPSNSFTVFRNLS